jgi:transposase
MQGKKIYTEKLFTNFQLSDCVPEDNFYRRLKQQLNLQFLYKATKPYYGTEGQASIDPVVFFKLLLVGYFENLNSDRKIIAHSALRLDILFFIGYDMDEELPWHSTLSRTRQLYGEDIFLKLFQQILSLCVSKGMVGGKRQTLDSAYIKANASMGSLAEKEILDDAKDYTQELTDNEQYSASQGQKTVDTKTVAQVQKHHRWKKTAYRKQTTGRKKNSEDTFDDEKIEDQKLRGKFLSNHTHYSTTDADSRISVKPGKPRQLTYSAQTSVDTKKHVITNIQADYSDKRDSEALIDAVQQTKENLAQNNLELKELLADAGYSSGTALKYLEQNNIDAYIPNFGQYKNSRDGFIFNAHKDQYECQQGNKAVIVFKGIKTDSKGYQKRSYRSSETDCKNCPLRLQCCGKITKFKKIEDSIDKPYYDRMHEKLQTRKAKIYKKIRSATVEPVLGTLINFGGMKRIWTRGIQQANKFMLGAAIAYNLKKWLNYAAPIKK